MGELQVSLICRGDPVTSVLSLDSRVWRNKSKPINQDADLDAASIAIEETSKNT